MSNRAKPLFVTAVVLSVAALLLVAAPSLAGGKPEISLEKAKNDVIMKVFKGQLAHRTMFAHPQLRVKGTKIASWRNASHCVLEHDSWFFFVDEQPEANWEHAAHYVFVDARTGAIRNVSARTPPVKLLDMRPINAKAEKHLEILKKNIMLVKKDLIHLPIKISIQKRYAVLVSGGWDASNNHSRYWNDLSSVYKALRNKYKFAKDEIIVLYANGTHSPNSDLDGDGTNDINYAATKANLTTVMKQIGQHIPKDGKFFFYSTNHGGQESGKDAILYLWGEWIKDDELAALSKLIKCEEHIYVMEQCYSGGMMDDLLAAHPASAGTKVCVMTAANYDEVSWSADTEGDYDEYIYHWTAAIAGKTPGGTVVNADTNGDGVVSMQEAHEYAKKHDSRSEHPQIGTNIRGACNGNLFPKIKITPK